jgi:hypothetical protein
LYHDWQKARHGFLATGTILQLKHQDGNGWLRKPTLTYSIAEPLGCNLVLVFFCPLAPGFFLRRHPDSFFTLGQIRNKRQIGFTSQAAKRPMRRKLHLRDTKVFVPFRQLRDEELHLSGLPPSHACI